MGHTGVGVLCCSGVGHAGGGLCQGGMVWGLGGASRGWVGWIMWVIQVLDGVVHEKY